MKWIVSFDIGPHISESCLVEAEDRDSAVAKGFKWCKEHGYNRPMLNWAKQVEG